MNSELDYPQIRYLEAFPVEHGEELYYYIRDPLEIASNPLVISPVELFILSLFDGRHSRQDIKQKFSRKFGGLLLKDEQLEQIIAIMETNFYLNSPAFEEHLRNLREEFLKAPVRPAWHSGNSYAADPLELKKQLEDFYRHPEGAGLPGQSNGPSAASQNGYTLQAILAPHIDLRVGGPCYTHAYRELWQQEPADLYIILGVAHYGGNGFFTATAKDFETPLGAVQTDKEFLETWQTHAGQDFTKDEWAHRTEHSIEFQLPFLQHGAARPFKILPVLCGSVEPYFYQEKSIDEAPEISAAVTALRRTIREYPGRVQIILSVDLTHMGPKFGDPDPVTEEQAREIEQADRNMMAVLSRLDRSGFQKLLQSDLLPRRVDACSAAYTLLMLMEDGNGKTVGYGQNFQPDTHSLVSYASMVFYGPPI